MITRARWTYCWWLAMLALSTCAFLAPSARVRAEEPTPAPEEKKANEAGDTKKGFKSHVNGCVLLGKSHGFLADQRAVLSSRITIRKFRSIMADKAFTLHVIGGDND